MRRALRHLSLAANPNPNPNPNPNAIPDQVWRALRHLSLAAAGDELSRRLEAFLADPRHMLIQQAPPHPHPHPQPHPHPNPHPHPHPHPQPSPSPSSPPLTLPPKQAQAAGAMHLTRRELGRVAGRATEAAYRATVTELKVLQELVAH